MAVIASPSVKTPSCAGGSAVAFRLSPGAWRSGTRGLSTTCRRPRGLERRSSTRASGTRRVCTRPLYGESSSCRPASEASSSTPAAGRKASAPARGRSPSSHQAAAAAITPSAPIASRAVMGKSTNSVAITPRLPRPAPMRSAA